MNNRKAFIPYHCLPLAVFVRCIGDVFTFLKASNRKKTWYVSLYNCSVFTVYHVTNHYLNRVHKYEYNTISTIIPTHEVHCFFLTKASLVRQQHECILLLTVSEKRYWRNCQTRLNAETWPQTTMILTKCSIETYIYIYSSNIFITHLTNLVFKLHINIISFFKTVSPGFFSSH